MNVYDFDKTIYKRDSTLEFYLFLLSKKIIIWVYIPYHLLGFLLYSLKIIKKDKFKSMFYACFRLVKNLDEMVNRFWETRNVMEWYLEIKQDSDVIISASSELLLKPITDKLGVTLIASLVSKEGKLISKNCYGEEKVKRFYEKYPDGIIDNCYSDSLSDRFLFNISNNSFLVKKGKLNGYKK